MTAKERLLREVEQAPDDLLEEVLNFLLFTKSKQATEQPLSHNNAVQTAHEVKDTNSTSPIWDSFSSFTENIPEDVLAQMPTDGAEQHDHYIYGTPKRP